MKISNINLRLRRYWMYSVYANAKQLYRMRANEPEIELGAGVKRTKCVTNQPQ